MSRHQRFEGKLILHYDQNASEILGREKWRVKEDFRYYINDEKTEWVDIPKGYLTDGATVPRPFWSIAPPWGPYAEAATVHDRLCEYLTVENDEGKRPITRKRCDEIFLEIMEITGVSWMRRKTMSRAVNAFRRITRTSEPQLNEDKLELERLWRRARGYDEHSRCDEPADRDEQTLREEQQDEKEGRHVDLNKDLELDMITIIEDKLVVEGGHVDHFDDLGGETNWGITKEVAEKDKSFLVEQFDWDGQMKSLSSDMAIALYEKNYWKPLHLDAVMDVHPLIADKLFDIGINAGPARAGLWLQQYLNACNRGGELYDDIATDGVVGPITLKTLNQYVTARGKRAKARLLKALLCQQGHHYINISLKREQNQSFTYGWMARLEHNVQLYNEVLWK